jgi:hypothetical protein
VDEILKIKLYVNVCTDWISWNFEKKKWALHGEKLAICGINMNWVLLALAQEVWESVAFARKFGKHEFHPR